MRAVYRRGWSRGIAGGGLVGLQALEVGASLVKPGAGPLCFTRSFDLY